MPALSRAPDVDRIIRDNGGPPLADLLRDALAAGDSPQTIGDQITETYGIDPPITRWTVGRWCTEYGIDP